jgi:hypothetical protein
MKHYHVCLAIESVIENAEYLTVFENGKRRRATEREIVIELGKAYQKGFKVFPACDHHDERGHCRGHTIYMPVERHVTRRSKKT